MPVLCYVLQVHDDDDYDDDDGDLQVHDCLIIILGCLSGIEENLVFAFATKGWHMYFGTGMSALRWAVSSWLELEI